MNLERQFNPDLNTELEKQRKFLRQVLEAEKITSDQELRKSALRYSLSYFEQTDPKINHDVVIWEEERRMRMFLIEQITKWLYPDKQPDNIIECGSAGDISIALTLSQAQVVSVDKDPLMFLHCPYNYLPDKFFKKIGREHVLKGYGTKSTKELALVEQLVPNWKKEIADARKLPFTDESFDVAWVQGTPDLRRFLPEMSRVIKPNGYIISAVQGEPRANHQSAYKTKEYESYSSKDMELSESEWRLVTPEIANKLGIKIINIPDQFKNYEDLCTWRSNYQFSDLAPKGTERALGFVFEVFKKK